MIDDSYAAALERAPERHEVLLGPVACKTCSAWVEWAGVGWLALGTTEPHDCAPFMQDAWRPHLQQAFAGLARVRPSQAYGVMQAHPWGTVTDRHPEWWEHRRTASRGRLLALTLLFVAALWLAALWVLASLPWPQP